MEIAAISVFLFITLFIHTFCVETALNIYILAGQSNMSGRGSIINGTVPPQCRPSSNILRFSANRTWEEAREPLHYDIDTNKTCGVGPGMAFANTLLQRDPEFGTIGLVPCAVGGTSIMQWRKGAYLYETMLSRAEAAAANGTGGVIRALLWYQGEADTGLEDARLYKSRFQKFIKDVRADLHSPSLPVIEVALDYLISSPTLEMVRKAQLDTAVELPNVRCTDASGLQINLADRVHLTTPAQVQLGAKMADEFIFLQIDQQRSCYTKLLFNLLLGIICTFSSFLL